MDRNGPTATVQSVARIDQALAYGGLTFNLKFSPLTLSDDKGFDALCNLVGTYFRLNGQQVMLTVADAGTLIEAQRQPQIHLTKQRPFQKRQTPTLYVRVTHCTGSPRITAPPSLPWLT